MNTFPSPSGSPRRNDDWSAKASVTITPRLRRACPGGQRCAGFYITKNWGFAKFRKMKKARSYCALTENVSVRKESGYESCEARSAFIPCSQTQEGTKGSSKLRNF